MFAQNCTVQVYIAAYRMFATSVSPFFGVEVVDLRTGYCDVQPLVSIAPVNTADGVTPVGCDVWAPSLAPSKSLVHYLATEQIDWHEFARRYAIEIQEHKMMCEWLRSVVHKSGLVLCSDTREGDRSTEFALVEHIRQLECEDRWKRGLMIGGLLSSIRDEIVKVGGLYFARHKAWMMPDRQAWEQIQGLLPAEF